MAKYIEEYVEFNGCAHYVLQYPCDSDVVVLYLHGGPAQSEAFFAYYTRPSLPFYNFITYDQRGCGKTQLKSKCKAEDISPEVLIDDLLLCVKWLKSKYKTDKIILLGHSWGSYLGLKFAQKFGNEIAAYIGMGQVVNFKEGEKIAYEEMEKRIKARKNKVDEWFCKKHYAKFDKTNDFKLIARMRKYQNKYGLSESYKNIVKLVFQSPITRISDLLPFVASFKINKNIMDMVYEIDFSKDLEYNLPIFFICGENDYQVPRILAQEYLERLNAPMKKFYMIDGAGHMPDLDNPQLYNEYIKEIIEMVFIDKNKSAFNNKADVYSIARPSYPSELIDFICKNFIQNNSIVADIGSGTGKLTELLLKRGLQVYAVEPNDQMRSVAEDNLKNYNNFYAYNGSAENTGLEGDSIDLITVAQAFHWFDCLAFKKESERILKKDGRVVLVWNDRVKDNFAAQEREIIEKYCPKSKNSRDNRLKEVDDKIAEFFDGKYIEKTFPNARAYTKKDYVAFCLSKSYAITDMDDKFSEFVAELERIFDINATDEIVEINYQTNLYYK